MNEKDLEEIKQKHGFTMIKFCPDLTSKEEVMPMMVGQGTFTRPVLHKCLQNKCVAYKLGKCLKYDNCTEYCLEKVDERIKNKNDR